MQPIPVENIADGGENSLGAQPLGPPRGAGDCRDLVSVSNQQRDKQAAYGSGRAGQKYPHNGTYALERTAVSEDCSAPARVPVAAARPNRGVAVKLAVIGRRLCEPLTGVGRYLEALLAEWGRPQSPFERVRVYLPGSPRVEPDAFGDKIEFRVVAGSLPPLL